jgi:hypothetical protein
MNVLRLLESQTKSHSQLEEKRNQCINTLIDILKQNDIKINSIDDLRFSILIPNKLNQIHKDLNDLYYLESLMNETQVTNIDVDQSEIRIQYFNFFRRNNFIKY